MNMLENIIKLGTEYLPSFGLDIIVTFIGFFLALKGEKLNERRKDKEDAIQCLDDIREELILISSYINKLDLQRKCYISPLKTPVWNGMIGTNKVQLLTKYQQAMHKKRMSTVWYDHLFEVYGSIDEFNRWCDLFTETNYEAMLLFDEPDKIVQRTNSILQSLYELKSKLTQERQPDSKYDGFTSINELISEINNIEMKGSR